MERDTIYALSSGAVPSGVAVIRVSGPASHRAIQSLAGRLPVERLASLMTIRNGEGELIDRALVLRFDGPRSFTGEDCAEFHLHGGKAVVASVSEALSDVAGCRPAEAGEFSRRAFENGKLDLVEAEGLAELIHAETEAQRRLAQFLASGHLSKAYGQWMSALSSARALIEAELDFADEGDVPGSVSERVWNELAVLHETMKAALNDRVAEIIQEGFRVVIAGPPNAGKSSLLNYLAKRDVAIVTEIPGTTRDILEVSVDLEGTKVVFADTAGLRATEDPVEAIGIERATAAIRDADLVLYLTGVDGSEPMPDFDRRVLNVRSKSDLLVGGSGIAGVELAASISTRSGAGIDSLLKQISTMARAFSGNGSFDTPLLSRHRNHVATATQEIGLALRGQALPLEVRAEHLRAASEALGRLTGRVRADDLLGLVFSQFCIGK